MTQKNEAPALIVSLLITVGLIVGGAWWFLRQANFNPGSLLQGGRAPSGQGAAQSGQGGSDTASLPAPVQTFSQVEAVPSGLFNYGGSTTWAPIRGRLDPLIQQAFPQFQLRYTDPVGQPPGSSIGIQMLLDGQLAFAQSSVPLGDAQYQQAQQRGFTLQQIPVALEGVAIAVNPSLNIPGLTLEQLREIYTGQITNWSQVGGPTVPITPYSRRDVGGTVEFFVDNVLEGDSFGNNVQAVPNTTEALRQVANDPGGIYYASAPEVVGQCSIRPLPVGRQPNQFIAPYEPPLVPPSQCPAQRNQINLAALKSGDYPITRTLFVIVKQNGQAEQQAGEAYANFLRTEEAQSALLDLGFVPLP